MPFVKERSLLERFEEKYIPEPMSGCWLWTGADNGNGYAMISIARSKSDLAHRVSYELHKGKIPAGMEVDHLCRVRCCVNPEHLEVVTTTENHFRARKKHCIHGHQLSGDNLRIWTSKKTKKSQRICITCHRASSAAHNEKVRVR